MNKKNISLLHRKKRSITKISESNNVDVLQQNNVDVNNNTIETSTTTTTTKILESDVVDVLQQNNNNIIETSTTKISELESELESNIVDVLQTNNIKKNFILDAELELEN